MKKRGLIISVMGLVLIGISISITFSITLSNVAEPNDLSMATLFDEIFDEITNEITIVPGELAYVSYDTSASDVPFGEFR